MVINIVKAQAELHAKFYKKYNGNSKCRRLYRKMFEIEKNQIYKFVGIKL